MAFLLGPDGQPLQTRKDSGYTGKEDEAITARFVRGQYSLPWPSSHMQPLGFLEATPECAAAWMFLRLAHRIEYETPRQVTVEGDEDTRVDLRDVAQSVATMYGVELADMFAPEVNRRCREEAAMNQRPILKAIADFIASGGQLNSIHDRNADVDSGSN